MTLAELSARAQALDLRIRQIDHFAFLNDDGLPLFTVDKVAGVIHAIEEAGDYTAWLRA
jgi:hypothetical protein